MKNIDDFLEKVKNRKILFVYPHPDDESVMAGGLIQRALAKKFQVTVLTLTEGSRGKIHINGKGRSVTEIRRDEMAGAMSRLGVADWVMWKFEDGKLRKYKKWRVRLRKFIEETEPGVVVTYDLSGVTGHPDHIALSLEILRIFKKTKGFRLLWTSFEEKSRLVSFAVTKYLIGPRYRLDLSWEEAKNKWLAAYAHKSQGLVGYLGLPWWVLVFTSRKEWYSEAKIDRKYKYRFTKFKI